MSVWDTVQVHTRDLRRVQHIYVYDSRKGVQMLSYMVVVKGFNYFHFRMGKSSRGSNTFTRIRGLMLAPGFHAVSRSLESATDGASSSSLLLSA